jgi:hypothetical protein
MVLFYVVVFLVVSIIGLRLLGRTKFGKTIRRERPLGLKGSRLSHGLLDLQPPPPHQPYASFEDFIAKEKRWRTMRHDIAKAFAKRGIKVHTCAELSWFRHFPIIHDHESRHFNVFVAPLVALMRFLAFWSTSTSDCGFDEYVCATTGQAVAIAQSVAKGTTLRGMWFYQVRQEHT